MIERFIKWLAWKYLQVAENNGFIRANKERFDEKEKSDLFQMQGLVGKKVISFSNEWEDMIFGTVTRIDFITQAKQPIPVIMNCLSHKETYSFGQIYEYDSHLMHALFMLTPYERWNLKVPQAPVGWNKPKLSALTKPVDIVTGLEAVGFI